MIDKKKIKKYVKKQVDAILKEFLSESPGHAWNRICYLGSYPKDHPWGHNNVLQKKGKSGKAEK